MPVKDKQHERNIYLFSLVLSTKALQKIDRACISMPSFLIDKMYRQAKVFGQRY